MADGGERSPRRGQACSQVPAAHWEGLCQASATIFCFLAMLCVLQGLSSRTRERTHAPCLGNAESQLRTSREVPHHHLEKPQSCKESTLES